MLQVVEQAWMQARVHRLGCIAWVLAWGTQADEKGTWRAPHS